MLCVLALFVAEFTGGVIHFFKKRRALRVLAIDEEVYAPLVTNS